MEWIWSAWAWVMSVDFIPRGECVRWEPAVLAARIAGDGMTALAYFTIPVILRAYRRNRANTSLMPANIVFGFEMFIFFCGLTHVFDIILIWWPVYRLDAIFRVATGAISAATAAAMLRVVPALIRRIHELVAARENFEQLYKESQGRLAGLRQGSSSTGGTEPAQ